MTGCATKLLIYSADFWPQVGGIQSVVMTLARGFAAKSAPFPIECTVVTETAASATSDAELPFRVVRKPSLVELAALIQRSDLVHIAGPALRPLVLSSLLGKKVIVEHHGFQALCPNGLLFQEATGTACSGHFLAGHHLECLRCNADSGYRKSFTLWAFTFLRRALCGRIAANISPTHWLMPLLQLPRTFVVPHGVAERVVRSFTAATIPRFAFVGRLVSTKRVDLLLDASRQLLTKGLQIRLLIIGDGPERKRLEKLSRKLGLASIVDFAGQLADDEVERRLVDTIALVVPSVAGETFGLVAAESMMRGRMVIVPEDGSLAEVAGETALKFASGDPTSLAQCMEKIFHSPEAAAELGSRARSRSLNKFSADRMLESHLAVYQAVLK